MTIQLIWEDCRTERIRRCKVFGGWLVETYSFSVAGTGGLTFVPDPKWEWDWNKEYTRQQEQREE